MAIENHGNGSYEEQDLYEAFNFKRCVVKGHSTLHWVATETLLRGDGHMQKVFLRRLATA